MRLLIFINALDCGGAQRVAANLSNYWVDKGWEVSLVTIESQAEDFYALRPAVRRVALEPKGPGRESVLIGLRRTARRIQALRRILKRERPKVALAMMHTNNVILALAAAGLRDVSAVGSEHIYPPRDILKPGWERLRYITYGLMDAVVTLTTE